MAEGENTTEQSKKVTPGTQVGLLEPISLAKTHRFSKKQEQITGEQRASSPLDFILKREPAIKKPTLIGRSIKPLVYSAKEALDFLTRGRLPLPMLPESWRYAMTNASYKDYDRTFDIDSVDEMRRWYGLHPGERGAILELAGFGLAPNGLVQTLKKKGIGGDKISYGLALARELSPDFYTPHAELVDGNLGEIGFKDRNELINMLKQKLQDNGCNGAALIYLRPICAYYDIDKENGINKYVDSKKATDFYTKIFTRVSRELLAHDGKFVAQIPYSSLGITDEDFVKGLRVELGKDFQVSDVRTADIFTPLTSLIYRTGVLTITKNNF